MDWAVVVLFVAESFWTNPQYRVTLEEPDDGDKDGICQVIVGLMQKDRRKARAQGQDNYAIGYMMYKVRTRALAACTSI